MVERELVLMPISYRKIGEHIRNARNRAEMTQAAVAEKLNISLTHYGQLERGDKKFTLDMLGETCELLNVRLEDVVIGALELSGPPLETASDDEKIEYINSLIKGRSPQIISTIAEVVESIIKIDRG